MGCQAKETGYYLGIFVNMLTSVMDAKWKKFVMILYGYHYLEVLINYLNKSVWLVEYWMDMIPRVSEKGDISWLLLYQVWEL